MARHPRAPDDHKHLELSVHSLSELSQIDPAEAKSRLTADEKFMHLDLKSGVSFGYIKNNYTTS